MAVKIELKRSAVPGKVPTVAQLDLGEMAINTYDAKVYFKQDTGVTQSIVQLATTAGSGSSVVSASHADYADTAGSAATATYATTAGSALTAVSASHAVFADTTVSSSYATTASYSISGSFAQTASYALNVPDTASFAISASHANNADNAISASHANASDTAISASHANASDTAISSSYALSGSYTAFATSASHANISDVAITAYTASSADDFTVRGNLTASNALVNGTITAQTLNVQYITSSTEFITGSTKFGSQLTDTHQFTGSVTVTGSLSLNGYPVLTADQTGSITVLSASYARTASYVNPLNQNVYVTGTISTTQNILAPALDGTNYGSATVIYNDGNTAAQATFNSVEANITVTGTSSINSFDIFPTYASFTRKVSAPSFTGSLFGTASQAISASHADIADLAITSSNAVSSSYAITASVTTQTQFTGSFSGSINNLQGNASYVPFFSSSQVLTTSSIWQMAGRPYVVINQTNVDNQAPEALYVWQPNTSSYNVISGKGNLNNYLQLNIQNLNSGTSASSDVVATANNGSESDFYIDMGINGENFVDNGSAIGSANDAYLYSTGNNLHIGNASTGSYHLGFFVGGFNTETNKKLQLNGNDLHSLTGSLNATQGFTGSLFGTASWAISASHAPTALTSSFAISASHANNADQSISSSYAISASYADNTDNAISSSYSLSGSYAISSSHADNADNAISSSYSLSGSYAISASHADNADNAISSSYSLSGSYAISASHANNADSAISSSYSLSGSYAISSSYALSSSNAISSSYAISSSHANNADNSISSSYAVSSSYAISASQADFAISSSYAVTASNALFLEGIPSSSFATTGSNTFYGKETISGSIRFLDTIDPDPTGADTTCTYLFNSASNTAFGRDLFFRQDGNLVKWKWIEGQLQTGLLYGGALSSSGSTIYVSSGSGIIVNYNASTGSEVSPIAQYVTWGPITSSLTYLTSSSQTYVYIDSTGTLRQQTSWFTPDQYTSAIPLGVFGHADRIATRGTGGDVATVYGTANQSFDFIRAFGPLKIDGLTIAPISGSLSISTGAGIGFVLGGFYQQDQNNVSHRNIPAAATSSFARWYRSGSDNQFISDTNGGSFYTTIDNQRWDNGSGTLQTVGNNGWTIQRVFINPIAIRAAVYYGQKVYSSLADAQSNISSDPFTEAPLTAHNNIFAGYLIVQGNASNTDLSNTTVNAFVQSGLFRNTVGGSGGTTFGTTLESLSDVTITSPANGQALIYQGGQWINGNPTTAATASYVLNAVSSSNALSSSYSLSGSNSVSSSYALTASYALNVPETSSFAISASYAVTSSYSLQSLSASLAQLAISSSYATTASFALNGGGGGVAAIYIADEGVVQGTASYFDFTGAGVTATIASGTASIYIPGGGSGGNTGGSSILNQTSAAATWSFTHDLGTLYPVFTIYDSNNDVIIPQKINAVTTSSALIYFSTARTGTAVASKGGNVESSSFATSASYAVSSSYSVSGSYAVSSSNSISSSYSLTASYALNVPLTASNANTASYAFYAVTASYALNVPTTASNANTASYAFYAVSSSNASTASYVENSNTSSLAVTASYALTASAATTFNIGGSQQKYAVVNSSVVGSNNLFTQVTGSFTAGFYKYTITSASNARSGEVWAVWNNGNVQYTDNSTVDIGTTTAVTFSVDIISSQAQFNAQTNTSDWTIKSFVTYM